MVDGGPHAVARRAEAVAWCASLARRHYENFPVASVLLPPAARRPIVAIYAFSRLADDVADEPWTTSTEERLRGLDTLHDIIRQAASGPMERGHPVTVALSEAVGSLYPAQLLDDLLSAFRQDTIGWRPTVWDQVDDYCRRSANPVGRLVLHCCGEVSPEALLRSDDVCTALQLINFWQDLSVDVPRGRHYLPSDDVVRDGATAVLQQGLKRSRALLASGAGIVGSIRGRRLRLELKSIVAGGAAMQERCENLGAALFAQRPELGRGAYLRILLRLLLGRWRPAPRRS